MEIHDLKPNSIVEVINFHESFLPQKVGCSKSAIFFCMVFQPIMHGLKAQKRPGQAKRHPGLRGLIALTPCKGKSILYRIKIRLLPLQGVTNERALTQGVASLALG